MFDVSNLHPLAILISTVVAGGLGAAWYSPALFGPAWMAEIGKSADELGPAGAAMAGSIFSCAVAAVAVDLLVVATGTAGAVAGAGLGALLGLGVVAMTMLSDALFSGWSARLYAIQTSYRALYLVLMGAICGAFAG